MSNQTSGPWSYVRNPENSRFIIDSKPGRALAVTAAYECDNEANARLIAAAPELLEALVALKQEAGGGFGVCAEHISAKHGYRFDEAVKKARAAIAKATGAA